jgi:hypothetical protein
MEAKGSKNRVLSYRAYTSEKFIGEIYFEAFL